MKIFNTICLDCGKVTDEECDDCFVCNSKNVRYEADITKKEAEKLGKKVI